MRAEEYQVAEEWGECRGAKPLCRESEGVPQI